MKSFFIVFFKELLWLFPMFICGSFVAITLVFGVIQYGFSLVDGSLRFNYYGWGYLILAFMGFVLYVICSVKHISKKI